MTFERIVINNVFRNLKIYIGYIISSIFSVSSFFIFSMIYYYPLKQEESFRIHQSIFLYGKEIVYIITIFFVIYFLRMVINAKKKEFGIYLVLGMSNNHMRKVLFIENIVIGIISTLIGIIVGIVFSKFFLILISSILEIKELEFYFPMKAVINTLIRYIILFSIIPIFISKFIKSKNIIDLIHYKKEQDKALKVSLIKCVFSISIIVYGYILVMTTTADNFETLRLPAILIIFVIGNYLFYTYVINYLIYLLSKIKKVYSNKTNFLSLSSLKYRIFNNTSMLFVVTILLSVTFTSIGTMYIQNVILDRDSVKNSPLTLNYIVNDFSKYDNDEKFIEDILKSNNLNHDKVKLNIAKVILNEKDTKNSEFYNLIKESEYNNIASLIQKKKVNISKGEAVLVPNYEIMYDFERKLIGRKLNISKNFQPWIKNNIDGCIVFKGMLQNCYIISDEDFETIYNKYNKKLFIGYEVENWQKISEVSSEIEDESRKIDLKKDNKNIFISRLYSYDSNKKLNRITLYLIFFVGTILYLAALSYMNFKFYVEIKQDKNKYSNMISLGLTFKELRSIISKEMMLIFFAPYILATINSLFVYRLLYIIFEIPILKPILQILILFFIINLMYFFFWRYKNLSFLDSE
ncbi:FtsX-like permease family protein [Haloimpatiens sp. FM7330]|uniref:FtsX-like permease family protein n=1 Tax=Haloimpatiens sp. FM7330 TaxID=3298610 RepID=UPI0036437DE8